MRHKQLLQYKRLSSHDIVLYSFNFLKHCCYALCSALVPSLISYIDFDYPPHIIMYVCCMLFSFIISFLNYLALSHILAAIFFVAEIRVSLRRLAAFLNLPEPPQPHRDSDAAAAGLPTGAIKLCGGTFDWNSRAWVAASGGRVTRDTRTRTTLPYSTSNCSVKTTSDLEAIDKLLPNPILKDLRAEIPAGKLLGVTGRVGIGKSTLLASLIGDLLPDTPNTWRPGAGPPPGGPLVRGTIAYCAQVPWIVQGTVRENILFGTVYD